MKRHPHMVLVLAMLLLSPWLLAFGPPPDTSGAGAQSYVSDHAVGWVVGTSVDGYGSIIHTSDGGQTWSRQGDSDQIPDVQFNAVWAVDQDTVWVVGGADSGYGVLLRTDDGGQTWQRQGSSVDIPNVELAYISAVDKNIAWVVGYDGVILHTVDGGQTWTRQMDGSLPGLQLTGVSAVDADTAWVCGDVLAGHSTMLRTVDAGHSWQRPGYDQFPATHALINVDALDADTAWTVGQVDTVRHTNDAGATWLDPSWAAHNLDVNGVTLVGSEIVWIVTDYGGIHRSNNGGVSWTEQDSGQAGYHLLRVSALDANNAWVVGPLAGHTGAFGVIVHTDDGGVHWETQTSSVNAFWQAVAFVDGRPSLYLPLVVSYSPFHVIVR